MRGNYLFYFPPRILEELRLPTNMREPVVLPNTVPDEGEKEFLRMIARADNTKVAGGGNFFIGLCNQAPAETDLLTSITSEPTVTNGYARQPVSRDSVGWPTEVAVSGHQGVRTVTVTFSASGGSFSGPFSRAFLCNVVSGTAGVLFSYSGALVVALTLLDTESFAMQYEMYIN